METIGKIRRWHRIDKLSISEIAKGLGASRNTVAKYLSSEVTKPRYKPREKRFPIMGPWAARLLDLLDEDAASPPLNTVISAWIEDRARVSGRNAATSAASRPATNQSSSRSGSEESLRMNGVYAETAESRLDSSINESTSTPFAIGNASVPAYTTNRASGCTSSQA